MNRYLVFLSALLLLVLTGIISCQKDNSQCTVRCATAITRIMCMNYDLSDVDTVIVTEYEKEDTNRISSRVYYNSSQRRADSSIYIGYISAGYDYRISIPATGQVFYVNNIKTYGNYYNIVNCKELQPTNTVNCADQVESFQLNGQTTSGYVQLYK